MNPFSLEKHLVFLLLQNTDFVHKCVSYSSHPLYLLPLLGHLSQETLNLHINMCAQQPPLVAKLCLDFI